MDNVADIYPLTPAQQGMLFHTRRAPESGVYVQQYTCLLRGPLDLDAYRVAWEQAVGQHPALRTAFLWEGLDEPLQVVRQQVELPWAVHDWRDRPSGAVDEALRAYLQADRTRGLDPTHAPLMRIALFQIAPEVYRLVWTFHHLLLDGWSTARLLQEIRETYAAQLEGRTPPNSASPPFRNYIAWLQQQDRAAAQDFWSRHLAGVRAQTPLSVDRSAAEPGVYERARATVPADVTERLRAMARRERLTLNTVLQGAWALLLSRYSGQRDVVHGLTVSGRPAALDSVETMIGSFINTLPLRSHLDPDRPLADWLREIQTHLIAAQDVAHTALVDIQRWSDVPGGEGLFESLVVFENYPEATDDPMARLGVHVDEVTYLEQSNYALALLVLPGPTLDLQVVYDTARLTPSAVERLLGHLSTMLAAMEAHPDATLGTVPLLAEAERASLLEAAQGPALDIDSLRPVHVAIAAQAARTPTAVAVHYEGEALTYGALQGQATALAGQLTEAGFGPGHRAGLLLERSPAFLVAMLAVLEAGGSYVPLDPTLPEARLRFLADDAALTAVLTTGGLAASDLAPLWVQLDDPAVPTLETSGPLPLREAAPDVLDREAYVLYTSGSTGQPKGVRIPHRQLAYSTAARQAYYEEAPSAFLLPSPLSFDSSVAGLYWTLTSGGALVLPPSGAEREVQRLATLISEHGVTHTLCVPLLYEHLLRHAPPEALVSLRAVIVAGEACPAALATLHADRQPATVLFNEYGPTESTVWATVYRVEAPAPPRIPIGHPIPGADAYVLDAAQRLVPVGVPGELYLGGPGLASGYLGRPDLTRTRFLPHPFRPEARLYRTGDRVRRLEDGTLDFLGRLDEQVKVRGHRIELGEVEAALRLHPHVASCAVAAPTVGERAVLAAYVVPAAETVPRETLDAHLRAHLPTYMVPDHLVFLEALPVNANGKVDRAALPRPVAPEQEDAFEPPLTPTELQMVALWEEVLEVRPISTTDSFFDLGGHSLLAALLFARIEETFERVIPLASLFAHPTPKALAALMQEPGGGRRQSPVCIQPGTDPDRRPLFLLPGAGGSVTKFYKLARHLGLEYPVYGLEVRGIDGREDAHTDIPSMAAYHLEELLATQPEGPYLLGGFSSGGLVAYEMACQLHEAGHEVADVILFDTYNPVYEHARKRGATRDKLSGLRYLRRRASGVRHSVQRDHQQRQRVRQAQHHLQQGTPVPEPLRTQWLQGQHEAALRTYVPRPYAGDVCFFSACGADKGPMNHRFEDGWRDLAGGTFTVYSVDGTHSLIREPFVGNVARLLREHLAQRMQTAGF